MVISSKNWRGKICRLVTNDGVVVSRGDVLADFRGDVHTVTGGTAPHKESSTGSVYVRNKRGTDEFFPFFINCYWEEM